MAIWKYLGMEKLEPEERPKSVSADTETVRKIVGALNQWDPKQARFIAAFAYMLSRVAHADQKISEEETQTMERIIMGHSGLPEEQAILVVQMAKTQNLLFSGTENFLVSREFEKIASREQKLALLDCLYAVSSADKSISTVEDNEINKISRELKLSHQDYIGVRLTYRDHLAVLKRPSSP
ncbi:MAG: TerB family tellurite resistance protein [Acidobacteria bacterium]|nr:TerB family tellurite resistance protein [Acidobacteriota bacterium]